MDMISLRPFFTRFILLTILLFAPLPTSTFTIPSSVAHKTSLSVEAFPPPYTGRGPSVKDVRYTPIPLLSSSSLWILTEKSLHGSVAGRPVPLNRHRNNGKFNYNPSKKAQDSLSDAIKEGLEEWCDFRIAYEDDLEKDSLKPITLFGTHLLQLNILFRLRRPRSHYKSNRAGPGRLKIKEQDITLFEDNRITGGSADLDNLIKFFLDSMNGVFWEDDRQVVKVVGGKVWDDGEGGRGD
ncbi:hypothetical protein TL16_g06160 [Triparma laevis f. inornata]|uniref:Uncharacterized protein n=1 Tax=Triparma laevis f. inornata TaxID=1714386 RepID=A0A9W7ASW7_9STRA|nr:hypothetical protein TL16_g06160 [Triparma laevis f. inornata]